MDPRHPSCGKLGGPEGRSPKPADGAAHDAPAHDRAGDHAAGQQQLERVLGVPGLRPDRPPAAVSRRASARSAANDVHARLGDAGQGNGRAASKRDDGTLHLGVLTTGTHILPPLLADFRRLAPGIAVQMAVSTRRTRAAASRRRGRHRAHGPRPSRWQTAHAPAADGLTREPFATNRIVIAWPDHPLAGRGSPPIELRHEMHRAARAGSGTARDARRFLAMHRSRPRALHRQRQRNGEARGDERPRHQPDVGARCSWNWQRRADPPRRRPHADRPHLVRRAPPPERWLPPASAAFRSTCSTRGRKVDAETLLGPALSDVRSAVDQIASQLTTGRGSRDRVRARCRPRGTGLVQAHGAALCRPAAGGRPAEPPQAAPAGRQCRAAQHRQLEFRRLPAELRHAVEKFTRSVPMGRETRAVAFVGGPPSGHGSRGSPLQPQHALHQGRHREAQRSASRRSAPGDSGGASAGADSTSARSTSWYRSAQASAIAPPMLPSSTTGTPGCWRCARR